MKCPNCGSDNTDTAKFCKKCGAPLDNSGFSHESVVNSVGKPEKSNSNTKIIIVALIIVAIVLAGALIYIYGFGNSQSDVQDNSNDNSQSAAVDEVSNDDQQDDEPAKTTTQSSQPSQASSSSPMTIHGGTFETGSGLSDKTYASIYVGPEHAGESVIIQIFYSRDGSTLNNGNMVPKTVDSSGYIHVRSADAYKYYPDYAEINLYDSSSNLLDTQSVSLSPSSGTQSF